jgi:hypothetical protein
VELDHCTTIPVNLLHGKSGARYRAFKESDIHAAVRLFEESQNRYFVKQKRTRDIWRMQQLTNHYRGEPFEAYTLIDEEGMLAYMRLREDKNQKTLYINEACLRTPEASEKVLDVLKRYCKTNNLATLVSRLSYGDEISHRLLSLGAQQVQPYAWQVKIVDYFKLFKKLIPLLEKRLASSNFRKLDDTLNFNFRIFTIRLRVKEGRIIEVEKTDNCTDRTIGLNPYVFPQLLLGYRRREELEHYCPDFRIKSAHKELVDTLFPGGYGYIHHVY